MGISLPKPVMTQIQERYGNNIFRCGSSCVNGYRESMEDAHLTYMQDSWGFFGVFDGHVNDQCSMYLEGAWHSALEANKEAMPTISDEKLKEMTLAIDMDWLTQEREGGSTGTFFIARKDGDKVHLQVGNVGDSRVIACINGECKPLTEDHKPGNPGERARIEDCGGRVENGRVDGCLAVSRAFGDHDYKSGPSTNQVQQKVIALADVTHADLTFNSGDFAILCCDGVFEGNFPNEDVISFIKEELKTSDDLAEISGHVCKEAIERGSRDNISCVIVQFKSGMDYAKEPHVRVVPGSFSAPRNATFRRVYNMMAQKGKLTVGEVLERRYDALMAISARTPAEEEELAIFAQGPTQGLAGAGRTEWFTNLFQELCSNPNEQSESMDRLQFLHQQVNVPLPILLSLLNDTRDQE